MRVFGRTDIFVEKFERILKDREDELKQSKTRKARFDHMQVTMEVLKSQLIKAVYPSGGGDHLQPGGSYSKKVLGVPHD